MSAETDILRNDIRQLRQEFSRFKGDRVMDADRIQGRRVQDKKPANADVLKWNESKNRYEPEAPSASVTHTFDSIQHTDVATMTEAQGDIIYRSEAGVWQRLAAGTSGQHLQTGGSGANPSWVNAAAVEEIYISFGSEPVTGQTVTV